MLMLKIRKIDFWEYLVYTIGLSIAFLMFAGLAVNWILPWLHITDKPLSLTPLLISFNLILFIFGFIAYKKNKDISLQISLPKINWLNKVFFITPMIFPILSILGAITLNNDGPNYLTMLMLGGIAIYVFLIAIFRHRLNENIYPWTILTIALSLLLMLSLRSWYISGFDISKEYQVFQITKEKMLWNMEDFNNIYNACLSITILPTILSLFLHVRDEYIFKFIFQVLFAITPVGIYVLLNKLKVKKILAFLSSLFYISNPWFIDPMTTLNRQEIAFFSFILILLILFEARFTATYRWILLMFFSVSMVVSHYSTTYVTLLIFILSYFLLKLFKSNKGFIIRKFRITTSLITNTNIYKISGFYILFLIASTFLWYSLITKSSNNIIDFTKNTTQNAQYIFTNNQKNAIIDQIFNPNSNNNNMDTYNKYYVAKTIEYGKNKYLSMYDKDSYKDFTIVPKAYPTLGIRNEKIFNLGNIIYKIILTSIEFFLFIGILYMIFKKSKKSLVFEKEYICLCMAGVILLAVMIILPYVSKGYNFDRLYMQVMIVLSLIEISGGIVVFNFLFRRDKFNARMMTVFLIINFLYTYGFIWQLIGGKTMMWLNNFGYFYAQTYTHKTEVYSVKWFREVSDNSLIYSNYSGRNMLWAYERKNNINNDIFPITIDRSAYVFLTYANKIDNVANFSYKGILLGYEYPIKFLDKNKNEIYNNGQSVVYK